MRDTVMQDLGRLEGDVFLLGGVLSNRHALAAFEAQAGAARVVCTGDLVAYCADPVAVVQRVRALGWPMVAGNCERQLAEGAPDCGCGFGEGTACDLLSRGWYAHAVASLGAEERAWMAGLPDMAVFSARGRRWAVIHGGATAINRFLWPISPEADFAEEVEAVTARVGPVDGIVAGHSGLAFVREAAGIQWVNPGSVGLPPHDGSPETRYAVLTADGPEIRRLTYDVPGAAGAMRAAGLTQGYDRALETGWWPSEDILPVALRRDAQASPASG